MTAVNIPARFRVSDSQTTGACLAASHIVADIRLHSIAPEFVQQSRANHSPR
jgi:hypothetical protein